MLLEEELVVLDLKTPGWPAMPAPYLAPLHSSAITCSAHVANVPSKLWARIVSAGEKQSPQSASSASVSVWVSCEWHCGECAPTGGQYWAQAGGGNVGVYKLTSLLSFPRVGPSLGAGTWPRSHLSEGFC